MTEFFFSPNAQPGTTQQWQTTARAAAITSTEETEGTQTSAEVNLRDALDWLLGAESEESNEVPLSAEDRQEIRNRRTDLLIWLMNLEQRLSPYGEPA